MSPTELLVVTIPPRSEPHRVFGATLRALRERTGENQFTVSDRAGIQKKSYAEYEMGLKAPKDLERVDRLCEVLHASEDERTALIEVWGSIGSNNRIVHVAAIHAKQAEDGDAMPAPVDPELRKLQDVINTLRRSSHHDAPHMWAGMLDAVQRIAGQGEIFLHRTQSGA